MINVLLIKTSVLEQAGFALIKKTTSTFYKIYAMKLQTYMHAF